MMLVIMYQNSQTLIIEVYMPLRLSLLKEPRHFIAASLRYKWLWGMNWEHNSRLIALFFPPHLIALHWGLYFFFFYTVFSQKVKSQSITSRKERKKNGVLCNQMLCFLGGVCVQ